MENAQAKTQAIQTAVIKAMRAVILTRSETIVPK